jgi:hypothetical protein
MTGQNSSAGSTAYITTTARTIPVSCLFLVLDLDMLLCQSSRAQTLEQGLRDIPRQLEAT